ncbi:MAG: hypothetical protein ACRDFX_06740 [Chloroflexota bacterium]
MNPIKIRMMMITMIQYNMVSLLALFYEQDVSHLPVPMAGRGDTEIAPTARGTDTMESIALS